MAVQALVDASDEDRATGGPDVVRGIYPIIDFCTQRRFDHYLLQQQAKAREILLRLELLADLGANAPISPSISILLIREFNL